MIFCNCKATLSEAERRIKNLEAKFKALEEFCQVTASQQQNVVMGLKERVETFQNYMDSLEKKPKPEQSYPQGQVHIVMPPVEPTQTSRYPKHKAKHESK